MNQANSAVALRLNPRHPTLLIHHQVWYFHPMHPREYLSSISIQEDISVLIELCGADPAPCSGNSYIPFSHHLKSQIHTC